MLKHSNDQETREQIVALNSAMISSGLSHGTSGNISARVEEGLLITPTGVKPDQLQPEHIVLVSLEGDVAGDQLLPSSEWEMHARIYATRQEAQAVVHCHSRYATILACARKPIPPLHYMIAVTASYEIPCAEYATFGSTELAESSVQALQGRFACLLANHGQIAMGMDLEGALRMASEVEELAATYWGCLAIGGPTLLDKQQMDDVLVAFASYGQQKKCVD